MGADEFIPLTAAQHNSFDWLNSNPLKKVISALEALEPDCARFVGGCVRDSLFGVAPKDFDIATTLTPEAVIEALEKAGLRSAPTGIEHGTVTAIVDHQGVEVTTLRADVSTDGRRATVAFTKDWATDAGRRDFTINAIYLTPDGRLYDPVGGMEDVKSAAVKFIGDAATRIREDYLRILRFFRFTARFASQIDPDGLSACRAHIDGIASLSAERIGAEFMAILIVPRAPYALDVMQTCGVLEKIWPAPPKVEAVERLKQIAPDASASLVLAALFGEDGEGVGARLRLSNAESAIRTNALNGAREIRTGLTEKDTRALIYTLGSDVFHDAIRISYALAKIDLAVLANLTKLAAKWRAPIFPLSGRHLIEAGVKAGPAVSRLLAAIESQWVEEDFPEAARLQEILSAHIGAIQR